ncbi:tetratricopeptide repeat protein [bacterium]|nr:tetratricopeptide repeat protein [bacterium]
MDVFFYMYKKELLILGGGSALLLFIAVSAYFFLKKWYLRKNILKNIKKIEFYVAGGEKSGELCFELGNNYILLEDFKTAENWYQEALKIEPDNEETYLAMAELYKKINQYQKLKNIYIKLVEFNPDDYDVIRELGWAYYYCDEFDNAIATFEKVKFMAPGDVHTRYSLGLLYLNKGEKYLAIEEYRELKKLDERKAQSLFNFIYPKGKSLESEFEQFQIKHKPEKNNKKNPAKQLDKAQAPEQTQNKKAIHPDNTTQQTSDTNKKKAQKNKKISDKPQKNDNSQSS